MAKPIEGTIFNDWIDIWDGVTGDADFIFGHDGYDTIFGYGGADTILGGNQDDNLHGDGGDDLLIGGSGADELHGGSGTDLASYSDSWAGVIINLAAGLAAGGTATGDTFSSIEDLTGSVHADFLAGNNDANMLSGINSNDILQGFGGADTLNGGSGFDTASYEDSGAGVSVSLISDTASGGHAAGDELDSVENLTGSAHADTLAGDNSANELRGLGGIDQLWGYGDADELWGGANQDFLYGMEGEDTLHGEDGHDHLIGGSDADDMRGGTGNDTYYVDNAGDSVTEYGGQGNDIVRTSVSYALTPGASIETLETANASATSNLSLVGNAANNEIIGNDGSNYIHGAGGADTMRGGGGNDTYIVDNAGNLLGPGDSITEYGGQGMDEVRTLVSWTLTPGADVEYLYPDHYNGFDPLDLTGNETGNVVWGTLGNNVLNGGDGNDTLWGRQGMDSFLFNTALDDETIIDADTNFDDIPDFSVADDTIRLDDDVFSSGLLANNSVAGSQFVIGAAAQDVNHRIIYNDATGAVYYDSDGTGGAAQILFATLDPGLALTNLDFLVVA
jgi:Ca2+-binding RTX toxin-like protein